MKNLYLPKTIMIPVGTVLSAAPVRIDLAPGHYDLLIGIGDDHTARLIIDEEALRALRDLKPEVAIY